MKRLLAWDSSTEDALISLVECDDTFELVRVLAFKKENCQAKQSERLLEMIHEVITGAGLSIKDLDCLAVGEGPGSFTGIRIGFTTAVTLSHVIRKPLVTVSSLAIALGEILPKKTSNDTLLGFYRKACLGEGYLLLGSREQLSEYFSFHFKSDHVLEKVLKESEVAQTVTAILEKENLDRWWMGGEDFLAIEKNHLNDSLRSTREGLPSQSHDPDFSARVLAELALQAWKKGGARNPLEVSPIYLRESDAERKLKQGLLKQSPIA